MTEYPPASSPLRNSLENRGNLLLGIGNTLLGDDGVGCYVATHLDTEGWTCYCCGTAPENFTGLVRKFSPRVLLLVDAADLGLGAGEFRIVPQEQVVDVALGTHQLPLTHLISFLAPCAGKIIFVGIQPAVCGLCEGISPDVRAGADAFMDLVRRGRLFEIHLYQ